MTAADEPGNSFYPYRLAAHHGSNGTRVRFVYRCRDLTCFDQISGLFRLQAMRGVLQSIAQHRHAYIVAAAG